jgi:hypothetical protein
MFAICPKTIVQAFLNVVAAQIDTRNKEISVLILFNDDLCFYPESR